MFRGRVLPRPNKRGDMVRGMRKKEEGVKIGLLVLCLLVAQGCTVTATRDGDTMVLKGFGAKEAKWSDGSGISKEEPFKVPDVLPERR